MLTNATCDKLVELGLKTMAEGLADQLANPGGFAELAFADRLGLLVDKEADARESRRLKMRLRVAKLRYPAAVEDLDLRAPRGLDRGLVMELATGSWVTRHHNVVLTGPTGVGKSYVACALAQAAIRTGHTAYYVRAPGSSTTSPSAGPTAATDASSATWPGVSSSSSMTSSSPRPRRGVSGSPGGRRGPGPTALDVGGEPVADRQLAPGHGGPHLERGDLGPAPPGIAPDHPHRSVHASTRSRTRPGR